MQSYLLNATCERSSAWGLQKLLENLRFTLKMGVSQKPHFLTTINVTISKAINPEEIYLNRHANKHVMIYT